MLSHPIAIEGGFVEDRTGIEKTLTARDKNICVSALVLLRDLCSARNAIRSNVVDTSLIPVLWVRNDRELVPSIKWIKSANPRILNFHSSPRFVTRAQNCEGLERYIKDCVSIWIQFRVRCSPALGIIGYHCVLHMCLRWHLTRLAIRLAICDHYRCSYTWDFLWNCLFASVARLRSSPNSFSAPIAMQCYIRNGMRTTYQK